jgi:cell wall-associated NlpC family hydrolase
VAAVSWNRSPIRIGHAAPTPISLVLPTGSSSHVLIRLRRPIRALSALGVAGALFGSGLTASSAKELQSEIATARSAVQSLQGQIAADSAQLSHTNGSLAAAETRLNALQAELTQREGQLVQVQRQLLAARNHLVDLENRLHQATGALEANLVANYEDQTPDLTTVILDSNGFNQLLEQLSFLRQMGRQQAAVVRGTRLARFAVKREVSSLGELEQRDRVLTQQVVAQRNQVAALHVALLRRQASEIKAREGTASRLGAVNSRPHTLQAQAAAQAAAAAAAARAAQAQAAQADATGTASVGGIAVDTGGMVQAPAGAPAAVREVIAAGNAIATLPYIYGGGHASFHADGYDCSGSVSYALAAAGLVSSPLDSGAFESWGEPGPGRWITIYANAGHVWMEVAGWRFDTVAQAETGTRWAQGGGEFAGFVVRHPAGL